MSIISTSFYMTNPHPPKQPIQKKKTNFPTHSKQVHRSVAFSKTTRGKEQEEKKTNRQPPPHITSIMIFQFRES